MADYPRASLKLKSSIILFIFPQFLSPNSKTNAHTCHATIFVSQQHKQRKPTGATAESLKCSHALQNSVCISQRQPEERQTSRSTRAAKGCSLAGEDLNTPRARGLFPRAQFYHPPPLYTKNRRRAISTIYLHRSRDFAFLTPPFGARGKRPRALGVFKSSPANEQPFFPFAALVDRLV